MGGSQREKRSANINAAIKSLVEAINATRDKQNEGVRTSVNKTYAYYMQNLSCLIKENKLLEAENDVLKEENAIVKERISQLDENAVKRVAAEKDEVIENLNRKLSVANEELANIGKGYRTLMSKYKYLVLQWNDLIQQPEIVEAMAYVEKRKTEEAFAKREEQARQSRYQGVIDRFINEGHDALGSFSKTKRIDFNEKEANAIFYGIMATASKDIVYTEPLFNKFLVFVDHMSCSSDTYVSLGGSNGCADQLTNWDGTLK